MPGRRPGRNAISETIEVFREAGFETSQPCDVEPSSFELAARREERLVLLKFLRNISEVEEAGFGEMKRISHHLAGSPLVVAERSGSEAMRPGVVYRRHGVLSVSHQTLADYLIEGFPPLAFVGPGGLYVRIDGPLLGRARQARGLSLGDVANHLGVSRRTVQKYEREGMATTVEKALRLEEFLQAEVTRPQDLLEPEPSPGPPPPPLSDPRLLRLRSLGFEVHPAARAPFDAVLRTGEPEEGLEERPLLIGLGGPNAVTYRRAHITASISVVVNALSAFFVEGGRELRSRAPLCDASRKEWGEESPAGKVPDTVFLDESELRRAGDVRDLLLRIEEEKRG